MELLDGTSDLPRAALVLSAEDDDEDAIQPHMVIAHDRPAACQTARPCNTGRLGVTTGLASI